MKEWSAAALWMCWWKTLPRIGNRVTGKETEAPAYLNESNFKHMKNKKIKTKYMKNYCDNFMKIDEKV